MAEAGILGEDDRVELIEGEVMRMTPIGRRHAACVKRVAELMFDTFRREANVGVQDPVVLDEHSEPQPDITLLHRRPDYYAACEPTPADVFLLIEVADSSAEADRRLKVPLYARSGVPEVWMVDLVQETITIYLDPSPGGYRTARVVRRGEHISPSAFPERPLDASDILG
ncbi:MAG: Uma2 family endonuclease [Chloroflexi bacterium]|nr:Uma2 family endonuclease [Chloroflexota bacterium]